MRYATSHVNLELPMLLWNTQKSKNYNTPQYPYHAYTYLSSSLLVGHNLTETLKYFQHSTSHHDIQEQNDIFQPDDTVINKGKHFPVLSYTASLWYLEACTQICITECSLTVKFTFLL